MAITTAAGQAVSKPTTTRSRRMKDGKFRVIVYSLNNDEFISNEGAVLNLPLTFSKNANCCISLSNIVLVKKDASEERLNGCTFSFDATGISNIWNDENADGAFFNVNGVRNSRLMNGINIINKTKVMVK